jgi:isopentenyl phosphate kinase
MVVFLKLGGSLITDKSVEKSFRRDTMNRLATEIARAIHDNPELKLLIGHGSGSFGHFVASRNNTINGVRTPSEWKAFAEVGMVASELNSIVAQALYSAGVPVWRLQPSASAKCRDGFLYSLDVNTISKALAAGLVPLVYGDVALDDVRGGTIVSTEKLFFRITDDIPVDEVLLMGEVEGVYDQDKNLIAEITPGNMEQIVAGLGGSGGVDVTGGMETKVADMLELVKRYPKMNIRIANGLQPENIYHLLIGKAHTGTLIHA